MLPENLPMRVLRCDSEPQLQSAFRRLAVDPYGIKIMLPKAQAYCIELRSVPAVTATILKQEMLSLGGEVALPRDVLTGKLKCASCLVIGNFSQFKRLKDKLQRQPFGLGAVGMRLFEVLDNYRQKDLVFEAGGFRIKLGSRTRIMGIINLTPDSFSGDGMYADAPGPGRAGLDRIVERARQMAVDGASIIDVGGESSRPGARAISLKEELARTIPVIKKLSKVLRIPVSIDTCKPQVARQALDNGAVIVNDISGLRDPLMAKTVARFKAGVVIMHMRGNPKTMQKDTFYADLMGEISAYLEKAIRTAKDSGIGERQIIVDPGIGFSKTAEQNLEILGRLAELRSLGRPVLVGVSRKSFIGKILRAEPSQRLMGSVAACVMSSRNGAHMVRVHDVKEVSLALRVADAIMKA